MMEDDFRPPGEGDDYNYDGVNYNAEDFPLEIFPENIKKMILLLEKTMDFQPQTTAAGILFAVSTAIGSKRLLHVKNGWDASASLWLAIIGNTGSMKSHPINFSIKPLYVLEDDFNDDYLTELASYNKLKKNVRDETPKPIRKNRYTSDTTTEGLVLAFSNNPEGIGIHKDELKGLFQSFDQYKAKGGSDQEFYLTAFDNGSFKVTRVSRDAIYIKNMYFPMIGSIQPEVLRELAANKFDNGMVQRWLYIENLDKNPEFTMNEIPETMLEDYNSFIEKFIQQSLKDQSNEPKKIQFIEESRKYFILKMNNLQKLIKKEATDKRMASYLSKIKTYYPRFINIIGAMNNENEFVSNKTVFSADNLVDYFISSAESAFIEMDNQANITRIFKLEKADSKTKKVNALLKHLPNLLNSKIAEYCNCSRQFVGTKR